MGASAAMVWTFIKFALILNFFLLPHSNGAHLSKKTIIHEEDVKPFALTELVSSSSFGWNDVWNAPQRKNTTAKELMSISTASNVPHIHSTLDQQEEETSSVDNDPQASSTVVPKKKAEPSVINMLQTVGALNQQVKREPTESKVPVTSRAMNFLVEMSPSVKNILQPRHAILQHPKTVAAVKYVPKALSIAADRVNNIHAGQNIDQTATTVTKEKRRMSALGKLLLSNTIDIDMDQVKRMHALKNVPLSDKAKSWQMKTKYPVENSHKTETATSSRKKRTATVQYVEMTDANDMQAESEIMSQEVNTEEENGVCNVTCKWTCKRFKCINQCTCE